MSTLFGPDYVRAIAPYQGGKPIAEVAREFGLDEAAIIKLASNENPLGMPESSKQAMLAAMADIARYPDSNGFALKAAISEKFDVPADYITLGNGSNDILELAAHALIQPGESVVYSQYSFAVYPLATQAVGGRAIVVPALNFGNGSNDILELAAHALIQPGESVVYSQYSFAVYPLATQAVGGRAIVVPALNFGNDLPAMAAAIAADTKLVFIANPNNPTGTFIDGAAIETFIKSVPPQVVVVLDEAYTEYLTPQQSYDSLKWVRHYPNLLVSRSLSKAYGLAGLRVGFGIAQPGLTDLLNRIRQPFNVNSLAQAAAIAALRDEDFLARSAQINADGYLQFTSAFDAMGIEYVKSSGNFVLIRVGQDDAAGARVNLALLKKGIIVRPVGNYGLPQWLRISIGLPAENAAFIAALKAVLA